MKVIGTLLISVFASLVVRGGTCDLSMLEQCLFDYNTALPPSSDIDQICKIQDIAFAALFDLERCVEEAECNITEYFEPQRELFFTYSEYCQPGCEDFNEKAMGFANCSLLVTDIASMPDKMCEIMQNVSDCMYEQINGCPLLEEQYGNRALQTLSSVGGSCELTYGGESIKGKTCDKSMSAKCLADFATVVPSSDTNQFCKNQTIALSALSELIGCSRDAGCGGTEYVAVDLQRISDFISNLCQPGNTTDMLGCSSSFIELDKCQSENGTDFTSIDLGNKESCKIVEGVDLAAYKECIVGIEMTNPECFYPLEDSTDIDVINSGMFPLVSELVGMIESLCSAECDNFEQAHIDVVKCLPKPSAEVMAALNVTSQMTGGPVEAECREIENWVIRGADCALDLAGECRTLAYRFNQLGLEGLVLATQNREISDMFQKSQIVCRAVTDEDNDTNNSGNTTDMLDCLDSAIELAKCQPENIQALTSIDFSNKESCEIVESVDLASYKKCLQGIEMKTPECFYSLEDSTDVDVGNSGKLPLLSGLIDYAESLCSADCDSFEKAFTDVVKCLPKPSAEVMAALNVTSQMTNGLLAKAECIEIEKWVKEGVDCAQDLVGQCKALENQFNHLGLEGLVMANHPEIGDMFQKSQMICKIKLKVTLKEDDDDDEKNNASGLLSHSLTVFVAILAMMKLV